MKIFNVKFDNQFFTETRWVGGHCLRSILKFANLKRSPTSLCYKLRSNFPGLKLCWRFIYIPKWVVVIHGGQHLKEECNRISHDVVTWDTDRDVPNQYCLVFSRWGRMSTCHLCAVQLSCELIEFHRCVRCIIRIRFHLWSATTRLSCCCCFFFSPSTRRLLEF